VHSKHYAEFITVTCLEWKPIIKENHFKDIIISSLRFLSQQERATIYAFVIMDNHFHLIWQIMGDHKPEDVQRDFLKFTAQQILKDLKNSQSPLLEEILVSAKDRKYQVWERNSLGIPLWSENVIVQKMQYIHDNPIRAGLCTDMTNYKYSSARFYLQNVVDWNFLVHYRG
jgi:putative transposase